MRVGFIVGQFPTLSETFVIGQMAGLLERGFKVGVICNGIADDPRKNEPPLSLLVPQARDWWGPLARLRNRVERLPPGAKDKVSTALDTMSVDYLNRFDVLVAHFGQNGARVTRLKKRHRITAPLITIFHGYDVGAPMHDGQLGGYRDLFALGSYHLSVSAYFRDILIDAGAPSEKVAVHRMGIDTSKITFRWRPRDSGTLQFISVCRLIEKKGIEFALRALASLDEIDWHYTIVGDGVLSDQLKELAIALGIAARVTFLGSLPHNEVKHQLARSHIFILPSVIASNGDLEGIPVALMEAMASGLTVISSYHSGIPELIDDGRTGFLASERDVAGLSERIRWIVDHPQHCAEIAVAARRKIELDFNAERLNDYFAALVSALHKGGTVEHR